MGYGHIGSQVSILAEAFGLKVVYYDVVKKLPLGNSRQMNSLDELFAESDFITLHVPETPETKKMMGKNEIAKMKKGSYLINASRGTVVEIDALKNALETGHLSGAAIDGDWKATEVTNPQDGQTNTVLSYTVDVRPRGPVPVAALEWQIREEVPTNLRAVKRAALEPDNELQGRIRGLLEPAREAVPVGAGRGANSGMQVKVDWYEDETMAAYLKK